MKNTGIKKKDTVGFSFEKMFFRQAVGLILAILFCAGCMGLTAYAMFTHSAYTGTKLMAAAQFTTNNSLTKVANVQQKAAQMPLMTANKLLMKENENLLFAQQDNPLMTKNAVNDVGNENLEENPSEPAAAESTTEKKNRWEIEEAGNYVLKIAADEGEHQASMGFGLITVTDEDTSGESRTRFYHTSQIKTDSEQDFEINFQVYSAGSIAVESNWGNFENYHFPEYNEGLSSGDTVKIGFRHAEFSFDGKSGESVTVGDRTYIQPAVSEEKAVAADQEIKVQSVKMKMSDDKDLHEAAFTAAFPVFDQSIVIRDYTEEGRGEAVVFDSSTAVMPENLTVDQVEVVLPKEPVINYYDATHSFSASKVVNDVLAFESPEICTYCDAYAVNVTYRYRDNAGAEFFYIVQYQADAQQMVAETPLFAGTNLQIREAEILPSVDSGSDQDVNTDQNASTDTDAAADVQGKSADKDPKTDESAASNGQQSANDNSGADVSNPDDSKTGSGEENVEPENSAEPVLTKKIEDVQKGDLLQTWDFFTGDFGENGVMLRFQLSKAAQEEKSIWLNQYTLTFEDGRTLAVNGRMWFFDMTDRRYVELNGNNWESFVGRTLMGSDAEGKAAGLKVLSVTVAPVQSDVYGVMTTCDFNVFANGILVGLPTVFRFDLFDVTEDLRYDAVQMQHAVETIGLYAYWSEEMQHAEIQRVEALKAQGYTEEQLKFDETEKGVSDSISEDTFNALRGQYFKIVLNKGLISKDTLLTESKRLEMLLNED